MVACGINYTIMIDMSDNVYVFGANSFGQLGLGGGTIRTRPTKLRNYKVK